MFLLLLPEREARGMPEEGADRTARRRYV